MRDYTVAVNAEYAVSTNADALECEDIAADAVENELKNKVDEIDIYIVKSYKKLFCGYIVKLSVNMVVNVEANSYEAAYDKAVDVVNDINYKECVELVAIGTYDAALKEDKPFLMKPKFAV